MRIYFMGLFHNSYAQNLRAVLDALKIMRSRQPDWKISVTCRCGTISLATCEDDVPIKVLPFASEVEVEKDMLSADLLYQPMAFQEQARAFARFSMSTKMITYLGSGFANLLPRPGGFGGRQAFVSVTMPAALSCNDARSGENRQPTL